MLLGGAYLYALLAAGELGVHHMLERFRQQIDEALVFLGVDSVHQVGRSFSNSQRASQPGAPTHERTGDAELRGELTAQARGEKIEVLRVAADVRGGEGQVGITVLPLERM